MTCGSLLNTSIAALPLLSRVRQMSAPCFVVGVAATDVNGAFSGPA